ncbi:hypothetical protein HHI31_02595 [Campylobacter fetus subsp. venerealis]|uniref:hypothetical protein n=1 Tax=Campylobacter fetus TaxID=196 RepID=UPI0018E89BCA|nr:hypothetical protein [Campylobacter fetus]QQF51773.1 hypothetical protein HHI31_02595 [Campylobacter fetus subsp. venerealis]
MKINDGRLKGYIKQAETNGADANTIKGLVEFSNDLNQVLKRDLKPNLNSDVLKGNNFVTYPNSAKQTTTVNQSFNVKEWVKNMSGVINNEWIANLTKLANKHPEMFKSEADVFRVIKEIKDNPTHFFKNYDDEVSLIGKQLDNEDKFANIGVVKDTGEIIHTNKNKSKDLVRLQRRNNEMLTGTPLPATTQSKTPMEGDLLQHSDTDIIPQSTSKKQILQSAKSKIANKEELNLEEKKALVEERRAEIKAEKEAKQKAEQEDKTSVINEKSVDNLPNLGKNEQNTPNISTNLASEDNLRFFTDNKGNAREIPQEIADEWKQTFNLKSLDGTYTTNHKEEIKNALGSKEIRLKIGSLYKLVSQNREQFIKEIKAVIDEPEFIIKDTKDSYILGRHYKNDDYFVNVSIDKGGYLVSISNGFKWESVINNKLGKGAKIVYQSPNSKSNTHELLQASQSSANTTNTNIIPQFAKDYNLDDFKWDNGLKPKKAATKETVKQIRNIQANFKVLSPKQKAEIRKYLIDKS